MVALHFKEALIQDPLADHVHALTHLEKADRRKEVKRNDSDVGFSQSEKDFVLVKEAPVFPLLDKIESSESPLIFMHSTDPALVVTAAQIRQVISGQVAMSNHYPGSYSQPSETWV